MVEKPPLFKKKTHKMQFHLMKMSRERCHLLHTHYPGTTCNRKGKAENVWEMSIPCGCCRLSMKFSPMLKLKWELIKEHVAVFLGPTHLRKKGLIYPLFADALEILEKSWTTMLCMCNHDVKLRTIVNRSVQISWIKQWSSTPIAHCPSSSRGLVALACVSSHSR